MTTSGKSSGFYDMPWGRKEDVREIRETLFLMPFQSFSVERTQHVPRHPYSGCHSLSTGSTYQSIRKHVALSLNASLFIKKKSFIGFLYSLCITSSSLFTRNIFPQETVLGLSSLPLNLASIVLFTAIALIFTV